MKTAVCFAHCAECRDIRLEYADMDRRLADAREALTRITEWRIDDETSPRETFREMRELAMDALQGTGEFKSVKPMSDEQLAEEIVAAISEYDAGDEEYWVQVAEVKHILGSDERHRDAMILPVDIKLTPAQIAEAFCDMSDEEQADFFIKATQHGCGHRGWHRDGQ